MYDLINLLSKVKIKLQTDISDKYLRYNKMTDILTSRLTNFNP